MTDLPALFLEHLTARAYSPETIRAYRGTLTQFDVTTATRDDAEQWWNTRAHLAPATRAADLTRLRSFYKWAMRWDHLHADPTARLDAPRLGDHMPRPTSRADLHAIMRAAPPDLRRAVALGAYAGLRVAEAAALMWANVDLERNRINIRHGKGNKDRAVGLSVLLRDELLPVMRGSVVTGGPPVSADSLQKRVNRLIRANVTDPDTATFHSLRSRFATVALADTGNLLAVSRALGHSSTVTTARYAQTADSDLDLIALAVTR